MKITAVVVALAVSAHLGCAPGLLAAEPAAAGTAPKKDFSTPLPIAGSELGQGERAPIDPGEVAADVLVVRPVGLAATAVGAAVFVVALPFAAIAKDVKGTASTLVGAPAKFTFQRRLGDFAGTR